MSFTLGILAIGSLYWDNNPNRETWRNSRLNQSEEFHVSAPIRYGRKSETRGNTYTMVFSRSCPPGQAKVVRCQNTVTTVDNLIVEAEYLWAAERSAARPNHRISASWGAVGLLIRPGTIIPEPILNGWAQRVSQEQGYGVLSYAREDGPPISTTGLLQLAWPTLVRGSESLGLDLLLATATDPTLLGDPPKFPAPENIAAAWNSDPAGNVRYFLTNRENGIITFQDQAILSYLTTP